jgi:uncharacterized protein YqeY
MSKTKIKLTTDLKYAILHSDTNRKSIIRVMLGELARIEKTLSDEEFEQKTISELKKMQTNALEQSNFIEYDIISEYLPQMLDELELEHHINIIILTNEYNTIKDMGKVMADLKAMFNGRYDGKKASDLIKSKLLTK